MMLTIEVPRKDTKLRLDERILKALREASSDSGVSFNALCEGILFNYAKSVGKLPINAQPLGDTRGGKRVKGAGKPKSVISPDEPQQKTEADE